MNNSPINSTINSSTVGELADATSLRLIISCYVARDAKNLKKMTGIPIMIQN